MRRLTSLLLLITVGVALCSLVGNPGPSHAQLRTGTAGDDVSVLARFDYGESSIEGIGNRKWTTGATRVTLPTDERGFSQFVLSLAFDRDGFDASSLQVGALDKDGNVVRLFTRSKASGAGSDNRVVTFVCAFKGLHSEITQLVIERRS